MVTKPGPTGYITMMHTHRSISVEQQISDVCEEIQRAVNKGDKSQFILDFHGKELDRVRGLLSGLEIPLRNRTETKWRDELRTKLGLYEHALCSLKP